MKWLIVLTVFAGFKDAMGTGISVELIKGRKQEAVYKVNDGDNRFQELKVTCTTEGCNKTEVKTGDDSKELTNDVVIQIKTNTEESKKNVTKAETGEDEELEDVPVVLGLGQNSNANSFQPNTISMSNFGRPLTDSRQHVRNGNSDFVPIAGPAIEFRPLIPPTNNLRPIQNSNTHYLDRRPAPMPGPFWQNKERRTYWWYPTQRTDYARPMSTAWTPTCSCPPNTYANNWNQNPNAVPLNQPGNQINDKLMPLN